MRELRSFSKSDYAGNVFGSRSSITFVMPAIKEFRKPYALSDIQCAYAFGPMKLVT
jgi:hypothetical protein